MNYIVYIGYIVANVYKVGWGGGGHKLRTFCERPISMAPERGGWEVDWSWSVVVVVRSANLEDGRISSSGLD